MHLKLKNTITATWKKALKIYRNLIANLPLKMLLRVIQSEKNYHALQSVSILAPFWCSLPLCMHGQLLFSTHRPPWRTRPSGQWQPSTQWWSSQSYTVPLQVLGQDVPQSLYTISWGHDSAVKKISRWTFWFYSKLHYLYRVFILYTRYLYFKR